MIKELVKMDLKIMKLMIFAYSCISILVGAIGAHNVLMLPFGIQTVSGFLEIRSSEKFLNVLPIDRKEILKSQIVTVLIIIGIFSMVSISIFFLGQYDIGCIVQSFGVMIVVFEVAVIKFIEFNVEKNNMGIVLKNIDIILSVAALMLIPVTVESGIYVFNVFLIISSCILLVWFLSIGRKYYMKLKVLVK